MSKKYGPPSGGEIVAAIFRGRGHDFDVERLEDQLAAKKSRAKVNSDAVIQRAKDLAVAARKARRACELDEADWRRNPSSDNLSRARNAQEVRQAAEEALRAICLDDQELISELTRWAGRS
jgi:hypothetical protein